MANMKINTLRLIDCNHSCYLDLLENKGFIPKVLNLENTLNTLTIRASFNHTEEAHYQRTISCIENILCKKGHIGPLCETCDKFNITGLG